MSMESGEVVREALAATIATALRRDGRQSAHPADQAALRQAAARVAAALQAEFVVVLRHSSAADQTARQQVNETIHE